MQTAGGIAETVGSYRLTSCVCFAREGGDAHGVHSSHFNHDLITRCCNKKRLTAPVAQLVQLV